MMLWPLFTRYGLLGDVHFMAKDALRTTPFVGWCMQACRHVFLRRKWEADEGPMTDALRRMASDPAEPYCLLMFPEGTDLSPSNLDKSHAFARKSGLPLWHQVLHPRVRGFAHSLNVLRTAVNPLDTVYDVTVAYAGHVPARESALLTGETPTAVHVHVDAYPVATLPRDEAGLERWLHERFEAKEVALGRFYGRGAAGGGSGSSGLGLGAAVSAPVSWGAHALAAFSACWLGLCVLAACRFPFVTAAYIAASIGLSLAIQAACHGFDGLERRVAPAGAASAKAS